MQDQKSHVFCLSKSGLIQELRFKEIDRYVMDISVRGGLCFSAADKKTLNVVNLLDHNNLDEVNKKYLSSQEAYNANLKQYSEENEFDMQAVITSRLKAGYQLSNIDRNHLLSQYFKSPDPSFCRGIKTFWHWLKRCQEQPQFLDGIMSQLGFEIL